MEKTKIKTNKINQTIKNRIKEHITEDFLIFNIEKWDINLPFLKQEHFVYYFEVNNCLKIIFIHKFYITASCKNFFIKKNKFLK